MLGRVGVVVLFMVLNTVLFVTVCPGTWVLQATQQGVSKAVTCAAAQTQERTASTQGSAAVTAKMTESEASTTTTTTTTTTTASTTASTTVTSTSTTTAATVAPSALTGSPEAVFSDSALFFTNISKIGIPCVLQHPGSWKPTCNGGYKHFISATGVQSSVFFSSRWGNVLSPYWCGRALAKMAGVPFRCNPFGHGSWMQYLPTQVQNSPDKACPAAFQRLCQVCNIYPQNWEYAHACSAFFAAPIADDIIQDTRSALTQYARSSGLQLPQMGPDDVVINDRCAKDAYLSHGQYGPLAFSFYSTIPQTTKRIFVCNAAEHLQFAPCKKKHDAFMLWLKTRYPNAEVQFLTEGIFESFARLVFAPRLYASQSTWTLWSSLANNGTVISPPLMYFVDRPDMEFRVFDRPNWHWSTAPVLMGEQPVQLKDLSKDPNVAFDQALEYLKTH